MELNSFKEVANNIGDGCGNVPIVLARCTVGYILYESSINQSTIMSTVWTGPSMMKFMEATCG